MTSRVDATMMMVDQDDEHCKMGQREDREDREDRAVEL
jgi:hypothetical protein